MSALEMNFSNSLSIRLRVRLLNIGWLLAWKLYSFPASWPPSVFGILGINLEKPDAKLFVSILITYKQ
jgi:hypothetical protein